MTLEGVRAYGIAGGAVAVALGAMLACLWHGQQASTRFEQNLAYHAALRHELSGLQSDRRILEDLLPDYRRLNAAGTFHSEDRLAWINAVDTAVRDLQLTHVRYLVSPQTAHSDSSLPSDDSWNVRASHMRLELGLAHAGELLEFLALVQTRVLGKLHVDGCTLARRAPGAAFAPDESNLDTICELDWLTLESPAGGVDDGAA